MERLMKILRWLWKHPEVIWSGAGIFAISVIGNLFWHEESPTPVQERNSISIKGDNNGTAFIAGGNITVNNPEASPELLAKYAEELGETKQLINSFFVTLLKEKVPRDKWDSKLREIAATHRELLARLLPLQSEDPQVVKLKREARQAIEVRNYDKAEKLLKDIKKESVSPAERYIELAKLQEVQLRYAEAAEYWRKAADLTPKDSKKERADYLSKAGYNLYRITQYSESLRLYEQSATIFIEVGDKEGENTTLDNINKLCTDNDIALKHLERCLTVSQEINDRKGEGTALRRIAAIHSAEGDYDKALSLLKQSAVRMMTFP